MTDKFININEFSPYIFQIKIMESSIEMENQKVTVNSIDLLKKFKTRENQYNFLRKMSKLFIYF